MAEDNMNLWDGFDSTAHVYDDKKEKHYQSRIWIVIACVIIGILISLVVKSCKEIYLLNNGQRIEAEYSEEKGQLLARFRDENGHLRILDISGYKPAHKGESITLYYMEGQAEPRPVNTLSSWLFYYFVFGGLLVFCIWRIHKIYRPRTHSGSEKPDVAVDTRVLGK